MSTAVRSVRARVDEWASWAAVAARLGLPLNRWVRRALNDQVELDLALLRESEEGSLDGRGGVG